MKKFFSLFCAMALLSAPLALADENFPSDPGTVVVDLYLQANTVEGDTLEVSFTGAGEYSLGDTVTITAGTRNGYTFEQWSDQSTENPHQIVITETMTMTAYFSQNNYTITFVDADGTNLHTASQTYGEIPETPDEPDHESTAQYTYTFTGWTPTLAAVTEDATYYAVYDTTLNSYAITFVDWDRYELETDTVAYGEMPSYQGETPTREIEGGVQYTFTGWNPALATVTGDATYVATYSEDTLRYTVRLVLTAEGDTLVQTILHGEELTLNVEDDDDYHFRYWSDGDTDNPRYVTIVSDTTFVAVYGASYFEIPVTANQWSFFTVPMVSDIPYYSVNELQQYQLTDVSFGYYDGAVRAEAKSGWQSQTEEEAFNVGQGYIVYSSTTGSLRIYEYPEDAAQSATVSLVPYSSTHAENANWNFVGNPLYADLYYDDINGEDISEDQTITQWDGTGYTNELLYSESLHISPLEAFFIQTDDNIQASLIFVASSDNPAPAREKARVAANPATRIDIHATAGGYTDKVRVLFRQNSSLHYEAGRDAAKFKTATAPVQLYILDIDEVACAQIVRPEGEDIIRLAFSVRQAGDITLSMPFADDNYELYDALTGQRYALDEDVTIYSEAGTFNERLQLRPIIRTTTAISNTEAQAFTITNNGLFVTGNTAVSIYNLLGQHLLTTQAQGHVALEQGTYIIVAGEQTIKVVLP